MAIIFEDRVENSPTFGCMCLGTMGFEIASSFKPGTKEWDFRTFGTGKGFFADYIVAGTLNANLIKTGIIKALNGESWINLDTGEAQMTGELRSKSGSQWVGLNAGGLTFQDWNKEEQMLRVGIAYFDSNRDINGVEFAMPQYSDFIRFSHILKPNLNDGWTSEDIFYNFFELWSSQQIVNGMVKKKGMTINAPLYVNNDIHIDSGASSTADICGAISWNNGSGDINNLLGLYGDNGAVLGYKEGENLKARLIVTEGAHPGTGDNIIIFGNLNCNGYTIHNGTFAGSFVNTYANTLTRTATQTFGIEAEEAQVRVVFDDIQISNGKAILNMPNKYKGICTGYTITSIVKKGKADVWVSEEQESRFIIEADNDIKVNVEIIIKLSDSVKSVKEEITNDRSLLKVDSCFLIYLMDLYLLV